MKKKVVLFNLEDNVYLTRAEDGNINTTKDYMDAIKFDSESLAVAYLELFDSEFRFVGKYHWCTRTFYILDKKPPTEVSG